MRPQGPVAAIAAALAKAQAEFVQPEKNKTVTVKPKDKAPYSFDYADYGMIVKAVVGPLSKNGICFTHVIDFDEKGMLLITKLIHESGESLETSYPLSGSADPKVLGGEITYGKRYSLSAITGCVADDDADADPENTTEFGDKKQAASKRPEPSQAPSPVAVKANPQTVVLGQRQGQASASPAVQAHPHDEQAKRKLLFATADEMGWTSEQMKLYMDHLWKIQSTKELNPQQFDELLLTMRAQSYQKAMATLVQRAGADRFL